MAHLKPRALHVHVLAALGIASVPGLAAGLPDATNLAVLDRTCAAPARGPGLPVTFEPAAPGIGADFIARGPMRALALGSAGPVIELRTLSRRPEARREEDPVRIRLLLAGANPNARAVPECETVTRSNYFVGEPSRWRRDVPNYARVRYEEVRPGIDIAYYGRDGAVEYDLIARPGSDPAALSFAIDGGDAATIDAAGDLVITTSSGEVRHHRPIAYQRTDEAIENVPAAFSLTYDGESATWNVGFELGTYDASRELVIDPVLAYSTFVGASGSSSESGGYVGHDAAGRLILSGSAVSALLGATGANIEVYKIDTGTNTVLFSTILGGSGSDSLAGMAVDASGNIYLSGSTSSYDFPTCFATSDCLPRAGASDAFAMRLSSSGVPNYSILVGGSGGESGVIAVDASGRMIITGRTNSEDLAMVSPINGSYLGGSGDIFVARIDPTPAGGIDFSTFLGSSGDENAFAVAVDASGAIYIGGQSTVAFPTVNPAQAYAGGLSDGIVMKVIPPPTASVAFATFVGGSGSDGVTALAVDPVTGDILAGGFTNGGMPMAGLSFQPTHGGGQDAFLARYSSGALIYSTYLGASGSDSVRGIAPDGAGGLYFAGNSGGHTFPTVNQVPGALTGASSEFNVFVGHLGASGGTPDLLSLLGGSGLDFAGSVARAPDGSVWVGGVTLTSSFPMVNPQRGTMLGSSDFFASRIASPKAQFVFNADARSDVLWRDTNAGLVYQWQMNGFALSGQGYMLSVPTNWAVAGLGDVNGDGKTDVFWREAGGLNYIWTVNGLAIASQGYAPSVPTAWSVVGLGDANADGRADVFWRNPGTGQNYLWIMNGLAVASQGYLPNVLGSDWEVVGVADFNGDNKADALWRNKASGQNYLWLMNGLVVASQGYLPTVVDPNWEVVGTPDTNGDTRADVLWRNKATGQNYLWQMNGMTVSGQSALASVADTNWKVVGYGDYNGDGKGDVLWRNATTGQNYLWLMSGFVITSQTFLPAVNGANWQPVKR